MRLKLKTVLASLVLVMAVLIGSATTALAEGDQYFEVEPNNQTHSANKVGIMDYAHGTLPSGDVDWYKFYLAEDDECTLTFLSNLCTKTINVTVYDNNWNVVFKGCPDSNSRICCDFKAKGLYYIQVLDEQNTTSQNVYNFQIMQKTAGKGYTYRYDGMDRYETSYNMFKDNWSSCSIVVIATGADFPDALSAAPMAKRYSAPIILTDPKALRADVENHIRDTGVQIALIVGGTSAVSKDIEDKLTSMNIYCRRIAGKDRYETNLRIAEYLEPHGVAMVTTGDNFPDTLSISAIAAGNGMPILLVDKNGANTGVGEYMKLNRITYSYIIGGTGAVSLATENYIKQFGETCRIAGSDRYETNIKVLQKFKGPVHEMCFATGENFPDALSGSVIAGSHPIVLLNKEPQQCTVNYINENRYKIYGKCIFGGEGVIPTATVKQFFPYSN